MLEVIGWIGQSLFTICAVPQAWKSFKDGHSKGLSSVTLWMWLIAEFLSFFYVGIKSDWDMLPLLFNYVGNFVCLIIIMYYKIWERS